MRPLALEALLAFDLLAFGDLFEVGVAPVRKHGVAVALLGGHELLDGREDDATAGDAELLAQVGPVGGLDGILAQQVATAGAVGWSNQGAIQRGLMMGELSETPTDLEQLLRAALNADGATRMTYRDPIVAHGITALERIGPWMTDAAVEARARWFAVRVVAKIAQGYRSEAIAALRKAARSAPDDDTRADAERVLAELGATPAGTPRSGRPTTWQTPVTRTAGGRWPGFQDHEFGHLKDTHWRARDNSISLAPLLVTELRYLDPRFESLPVERMPQLHLAIPARCQVPKEHDQRLRTGKLVVYAAGPTQEEPDAASEAVAGWFIEKGDGRDRMGPVNRDLWDWPWFLDALREDHAFQGELSRTMVRHDLRFGAYIGQGFAIEFTPGWVARFEEGNLVIRDARETAQGQEIGRGWDEVTGRLEAAPEDTWWGVHVWKSWPKGVAIAAGRAFAFDEITPVLRDLAGCYLEITRAALERSGR